MSSQTDICNAALLKVSVSNPITAISDRTKEAVLLRRVWDTCLRQCLALHAWPFAVTYKVLALLAQDPMPGWQYRYTYPSDCLLALAICDESGIRNTIQSVINDPNARTTLSTGLQSFQKVHGTQSTSLVTDLEEAYLIYVTEVVDTARFTPMFEEVLACRLAIEIAPSLAGETGYKIRAGLREDFDNAVSIAITNEYNEAREPAPSHNAIVSSRC